LVAPLVQSNSPVLRESRLVSDNGAVIGVIQGMVIMTHRRMLGLTRKELEDLGRQASDEAVARLKAKGIPITTVKDGKLYREHPDGRLEFVAILTEDCSLVENFSTAAAD
jgi:hypothetical protein